MRLGEIYICSTIFGVFLLSHLGLVQCVSPYNTNWAADKLMHGFLKSNLNDTADPCEDFYAHACGNWVKAHPRTARYADTLGYTDYLANIDYMNMLVKLEKNAYNDIFYNFVQQVVNYFVSCKSLPKYDLLQYLDYLEEWEKIKLPRKWNIDKEIEKNKIKVIIEYENKSDDSSENELDSNLKKSENKNKSNESKESSEEANESTTIDDEIRNEDWPKLLAIFKKYGMGNIFIQLNVVQDWYDSSTVYIDVDKIYRDTRVETMTQHDFQYYLRLFGAKQYEIDHYWTLFEKFELQLELLREMEDDEESQVVALDTLNMPWLETYVLTVFENEDSNASETTVQIQNLKYFETLQNLVLDIMKDKNYGNDFLPRYLMIRFLHYIFETEPKGFFKYDCAVHIRETLPVSMQWLYNYMYEDKFSLSLATEDIKELFNNLIEEFKRQIKKNENNFDKDAVKFLNKKLKRMRIKVGNYPKSALEMEEYHRGIVMDPDSFFSNHLKVLYFRHSRELGLALTLYPPTKTEEDMDSFFIHEDPDTAGYATPYYLRRLNVIIIPIVNLRPPLYHFNSSKLFKYGLFGLVLGHEMMHGFDKGGLKYDKHGTAKSPLENIEDYSHFEQQVECAKNLHTEKALDEKMSDVNGIRLAYNVYFNLLNETERIHPNLLKLSPYMEGSAKKIFFYSAAQFFCSDSEFLADDEHGTDPQRILDLMKNFEEFANEFECPLGSNYNPEKKCKLYR